MHLSKGEAILLFVLVVLIVALVAIDSQSSAAAHHYHAQSERPWWHDPNWVSVWINLAVALATIAAVAVGFWAFGAAKRSVESFSNAEEGRLWVSNIKTASEGGKRFVHYAFENVGRTWIEVLEIRVNGECIPRGSNPPLVKASGWARSMYVMLGQNKKIGTEKGDNVVSIFKPHEWGEKDMADRKSGMDYTFRITAIYKTVFDVVRMYRITAVWAYGEGHFSAYTGPMPGHTFDIPTDKKPDPNRLKRTEPEVSPQNEADTGQVAGLGSHAGEAEKPPPAA